MTAPTPSGEVPDLREAVARTKESIRQQVRDCIGETIPLRRRWVSAIMDRVVSPLRAENESLRSDLAAAIARAEEAERDRDIANTANEALEIKLKALAPHGSCGCSYDRPDDVCMHHSPALSAVTAELAQAKERVAEDGRWHVTARDGKPRYDGEGEQWLQTWSEASATYDIACIAGDWSHDQEVDLLGMDAWRWLAPWPGALAPALPLTKEAADANR